MRILYLLSVACILYSCNIPTKTAKTVAKQDTIIKIAAKKILKQDTIIKMFDIKTFEKNKNSLNRYSFTLEDGTTVEQSGSRLIENGNFYGFTEIIKPKDSLFEYYFEYYKNGKIKTTVKSLLDRSFGIGILKEYNQQGILVKETDLDEPFTYTWEDVKSYLKNHGVTNFKKNLKNIHRWSDTEITYWEIRFYGTYKNKKGEFFVELDGKTGEELLVEKLIEETVSKCGDSKYETLYRKK